MWTFMTVFMWELWRGFRCELERAFVNQDEVAVVREQWGEITNWLFDAELSTDCHLPAHISGEAQILLWFIFLFLFFTLNSPYTSIWESIFCDSPFTLTFDKCEAIPLHFREKKSGKTTTFLLCPSIYELISQIGKVLPNFLFSHHHFVQNGELQTFNFYLMGGAILAKWRKWKMKKDVHNWSLWKPTSSFITSSKPPTMSNYVWCQFDKWTLLRIHFFQSQSIPFFWRESQCQHLLFCLHLAKESTNI